MNFFSIIAPIYEFIHFGSSRTAERIRKLVNFYNTDRVLDLGGGTGRVARHFIDDVGKVFVADSSEAMTRVCKKHTGLECALTNAESLPFENEFFDKVIMVDAFHHFSDRDKVIKEVKRVLKSEGKVVISEFNPRVLLGSIIEKIETLLRLGSTFFAPDSLKDFWEARGFKVELHDAEKGSYYMIATRKNTEE